MIMGIMKEGHLLEKLRKSLVIIKLFTFLLEMSYINVLCILKGHRIVNLQSKFNYNLLSFKQYLKLNQN